jgi:acetyl-CoA carboxylase carboxyl transferase subunit alpha
VIIGEGASGGAIGIGVGDRVFMMENTWYSVISPESCSSILWRSWEHKERAAEALKLTAKDMLGNGLIDGIIKEPLGGAHVNPEEAAKNLQKKIVESLKELIPMDAEERIQERMAKFVKMGVFNEA